MTGRHLWRITLLITLLSGCAGEPFDYHPVGEIPQGPGLFSKAVQGYNLVSSDSDQAAENAMDKQRLMEEFQAFQRWKQESKESKAYREFLQWQQWQAAKTEGDRPQ